MMFPLFFKLKFEKLRIKKNQIRENLKKLKFENELKKFKFKF